MHRYLAIPFALALLVGCTAVREGAAPAIRVQDASAPTAKVRLNTVNIIDDGLQSWQGKEADRWSKIAVESTNSRRTATGTLEVWGVLRNRTDYPLQVEGRTTFFDQYEVPIEEPSGWRRVLLPPNGISAYKEFSTRTDEVAFYYIEIREGR